MPYYDPGTLSYGSGGPLVNFGDLLKVIQRVGGRAGTAAPQGVVCELPNPLLFFASAFHQFDASNPSLSYPWNRRLLHCIRLLTGS
jgi:hypothetical protein